MTALSESLVGVLSHDVDEKAARAERLERQTRNGKDFTASPVPALTPEELLERI